ncbi:hypothetical protein LDENG_00177960, partial [Lucifuga dentata]
MSHPPFNPYGNQRPTKVPFDLSNIHAERDPRRAPCRVVPGPSLDSSAASPGTSASSNDMLSSMLSQAVSYRPGQSRSTLSDDLKRSIDMHISRAREEVKLQNQREHQLTGQNAHLSYTQRDPELSSGTRMAYPMSSASASLGHSARHPNIEHGSSSLDWMSSYKRPPADNSSNLFSSSTSSRYAGGADRGFNDSSERTRDISSIPGLGDFDCPTSNEASTPSKSSQPKYTSESAASILWHFGLEKDDLEHLITYPENEITPDNLPFILREIRIQKAKKTKAATESKKYTEPVQSRGSSGLNQLSGSGGIGMKHEEVASAVFQPSKGSSHGQASSASSLITSYSSLLSSRTPPSREPTKPPPRPDQSSELTPSSITLPKKDKDCRVLKPEAPKPIPVQGSEADHQGTSKTNPTLTLLRGVHPSRPGLVVIGSKDGSDSRHHGKSQGQSSVVGEQMQKQQAQEKQQSLQTQQMQQTQQMPPMWPPVLLTKKTDPPPSHIPTITKMSHIMQPPPFVPPDIRTLVLPPLPAPPPSNLMTYTLPAPPPSSRQPPAKVTVFKGLPTPTKMCDYAAASPRIFPHTCSLCNKECAHMKEWISHQNTNLHLESCTLLRKQYPDWDGEISHVSSPAAKDPQSSSSSQRSHQKAKHRSCSRSRSPSPRRRQSSDGKRTRETRRSRSPSPRRRQSSDGKRTRETRRSRSRSPHGSRPCHRSRSRSPRYNYLSSSYRHRSRSRSRERRSPGGRSYNRRSPPGRRSHERRSSPARTSSYRKKSSSAERLAKKLLETSAIQSLSDHSDMETVVKTLAPALLAELAKMNSSSSSSSSSKGAKRSSSSPSGSKKLSALSIKAKPSLQKSERSSSTNTKVGSAKSPPTMVKLQGVRTPLSHEDVVASMENFGKTKSVVLFRAKQEALVCFERQEDAKLLRSHSVIDIKGCVVSVERESDSAEKKKPLQKRSPTSNAKTEKPAPTTIKKALLPTPNKPIIQHVLFVKTGIKKAAAAQLSAAQKTTSKPSTKGPVTVTKAKTLVSKAKTASTKQVGKSLTGTLAKKKPAMKAGVRKAAANIRSSSSGPAKKSNAAASEQKTVDNPEHKEPETKVKESLMVQKGCKGRAKVNKPANAKKAAPTKHQGGKTQASQVKTNEPTAAKEAGTTAEVKAAEPRSTAPGSQPDSVENSKPEPETLDEGSSMVQEGGKDAAESAATVGVECKPQTRWDKVSPEAAEVMEDEATDAKRNGETGVSVEKPMEIQSCGEIAKEKPPEDAPEPSRDKSSLTTKQSVSLPEKVESTPTSGFQPDAKTQIPNATTKSPESSVRASQSTMPDSDSTQGPETESAGSPVKAAVKTNLKVGGTDANSSSQDILTPAVREAAENAENASQPAGDDRTPSSESAPSAAKQSVAAAPKQPPATPSAPSPAAPAGPTAPSPTANTPAAPSPTAPRPAAPSPAAPSPTAPRPAGPTAPGPAAPSPAAPSPAANAPGRVTLAEKLHLYFCQSKIGCLKMNSSRTPESLGNGPKLLMITNLPTYRDGSYTENDVSNLFRPFGFEPTEDNIFVLPSIHTAFVLMPGAQNVSDMFEACRKTPLQLQNITLCPHVMASPFTMSLLGFYKFIMRILHERMEIRAYRTVFVKNISHAEAVHLRAAVEKIDAVTNFLFLLNKVFVEFETIEDADRFGVWYSHLNPVPGYHIQRLSVPRYERLPVGPKHPEKALPDSKEAGFGAKVPTPGDCVPQGSSSPPFWIWLKRSPFLFATIAPWHNFPEFLTITGGVAIATVSKRAPAFPTMIMVTGLPEDGYTQQDVARLVWPYFPKKNLYSMFYYVTVLPLQRR